MLILQGGLPHVGNMVLVLLTNGECIEVREAISAQRIDRVLLCFDTNGEVVRGFEIGEVSLFTSDPDTAAIMRREVCKESEAPPA